MARTIPVFRALAEDDRHGKFHQNYGQLGYALKDQIIPAWSEAEQALSKAIEIRGDWNETGWLFYEYNRAICRIMMDESFTKAEPSKPELRVRILADMKAAYHMEDADEFFDQAPIDRWIEINKVSKQELLSNGK